MQSSQSENRVFLRGRLEDMPRTSHINHGIVYYVLPLAVRRLSGVEDHLNIIASAQQLEGLDLRPEGPLTVIGEVRTFNNRSGQGSRLVISVFARTLEEREPAEDENCLELAGVLCKPPTLRTTPLGRTICDMILAVNRRYGRADYLPCIAWGSLAHQCGGMEVGNRLHLRGRLQSRTYTKNLGATSEERTAFEVSVMNLLPTKEGGDRPAGAGLEKARL